MSQPSTYSLLSVVEAAERLDASERNGVGLTLAIIQGARQELSALHSPLQSVGDRGEDARDGVESPLDGGEVDLGSAGGEGDAAGLTAGGDESFRSLTQLLLVFGHLLEARLDRIEASVGVGHGKSLDEFDRLLEILDGQKAAA